MCGIVGYIGLGNAKEKIIDGLKHLEYRGYDSAGISLIKNNEIIIAKEKGEIVNLEKHITSPDFDGNVGIGHTRWATHGKPSKENAHPHLSADKRISIVHNGIIENYQELKKNLIENHDIKFDSETDSEVVAKLIGVLYKGNILEAVEEAKKMMEGAYAIGVIAADEPDRIVAVRKDAPLIVGIGKGFNFIASDIPALLKYTRDTFLIDNDETVLLKSDDITIFDNDGNEVKKEILHVTWDAEAAEKGGYEHFMRKEIFEQPDGIQETLDLRIKENDDINIEGVTITKEDLENIDKVYIVACGTAYHAGVIGKSVIEKYAKIHVETDLASEFRYRNPFIDDKTLCIVISQSGETLDTLEALREAKRRGARILSIVNVIGSSIARESEDVFYTWAGPEIAVASTKAFTTQLICLYLLALHFGKLKGAINEDEYNQVIKDLRTIPNKMKEILSMENHIKDISKKLYKYEKSFYIGRGLDVGIAYEASLKIKEIAYVNSFAIAAGELKHGTIALVEDGTPFMVLANQDKLYDKMISNIEEIKARGAYVIAMTKEGNKSIEDVSDEHLYIPKCSDDVTPLLSVVPLQLLAYHVANLRGESIDKPRNLAKSVTVE